MEQTRGGALTLLIIGAHVSICIQCVHDIGMLSKTAVHDIAMLSKTAV